MIYNFGLRTYDFKIISPVVRFRDSYVGFVFSVLEYRPGRSPQQNSLSGARRANTTNNGKGNLQWQRQHTIIAKTSTKGKNKQHIRQSKHNQ